MTFLASKKTACYVVGQAGIPLAQQLGENIHIYVLDRLAHLLPAHATQKGRGHTFTSLPTLLAQTFAAYDAHVFFCATGIAVRCIAPHIVHKKQDPAVVVCDEQGRFAISLLSGHWGGGNTLASEVAQIFQATPVITTASDVHGTLAIDELAKDHGCTILDWEKVKICNAALIQGEKVQLFDPINIFKNASSEHFTRVGLEKNAALPRINGDFPAVAVDWRKFPQHENILRLTVPVLHMGIGCKKGTSKETIVKAITYCVQDMNLEEKALACLASVEHKRGEKGLLEAAEFLQLPLEFYEPEILAEAPSLTPSGMAAQLFGLETISVSEGAALVSANASIRACTMAQLNAEQPLVFSELSSDNAALIVPKIKFFGQVTVAVAVAEHYMPVL